MLLALLAACGGDPASRGPTAPPPQSFDFGTIPHGQAREHEFVLDQRAVLGEGWYAVAAHADCTCARTQMWLADQRGGVRRIVAQDPSFRAQPGELLVVRVQVDTAQKEAVDLGPVDSHVTVVLQRLDGGAVEHRQWPLKFRVAVDAPVRLLPFAVLDFGRVPVSTEPELLTVLQGDVPDRSVRFGPASCDDPRVTLALEPDGDRTRLRARFRPGSGPEGAFRALVSIATDLPDGYTVRVAAHGKVVPDLEATPFGKISIRTDLRQPQPPAAARSQYLLVTDHDRRRAAEFTVARLVDAAGRDASGSFAVWFEPIDGDDRSHRVFLRYLGGQRGEFRGELVLAKDPRDGPFLPIEVVALHSQQP
jgi:hypothetical protein